MRVSDDSITSLIKFKVRPDSPAVDYFAGILGMESPDLIDRLVDLDLVAT